jgi:hypothetical protein
MVSQTYLRRGEKVTENYEALFPAGANATDIENLKSNARLTAIFENIYCTTVNFE